MITRTQHPKRRSCYSKSFLGSSLCNLAHSLPTMSLVLASAASAQMVHNASFESDLTGWDSSGNVIIASTLAVFPVSPSDGWKLVVFNVGQGAPNGMVV